MYMLKFLRVIVSPSSYAWTWWNAEQPSAPFTGLLTGPFDSTPVVGPLRGRICTLCSESLWFLDSIWRFWKRCHRRRLFFNLSQKRVFCKSWSCSYFRLHKCSKVVVQSNKAIWVVYFFSRNSVPPQRQVFSSALLTKMCRIRKKQREVASIPAAEITNVSQVILCLNLYNKFSKSNELSSWDSLPAWRFAWWRGHWEW